MKMNPTRASLLPFIVAILAAPPPVAADSIVVNQCPGDQTAVPGQILNLPLFTVQPQPTTTWITIDCPPPGCESWGHSTEKVRLKEPVLAGDEPSVFEREFHNDTMVMWIYELESGGPADMWITHHVADDLEAGGAEPQEYQLKGNDAILQMTENPGPAGATFFHQTSLKEPLELAAGQVDTDCLARLSNATLRLENTGGEAVRLKIRRRVTRAASDGIVSEGRIQTAGAWDSGVPEMQSLRLIPFGQNGTDRGGDGAVRGAASVIRLEAGETFEMALPSAGAGEVLGLSVENLSGGGASLLKTIHSEGSRTLAPRERSYLLCIGAGDCYDNVTVETGTLHTEAATARFLDDLTFGETEMGTANNFDFVRVRTEVLTTLTAARVAGLEWCWTVTYLPNFTLHFQSGNTISMGTTVRVPVTAMPGDQILVWYTWTVMSGATTCTDTCHFHVNVIGSGAPERLTTLSDGSGSPEGPDLDQNSPNPFNPVTSIRFRLGDPGPVALEVFSADGRLVRTLVDGFLESGEHELLWDGRNGEGGEVASGTYFYRLVTPEGMRTRRMVLIH